MNLILFQRDEPTSELPRSDPRVKHILSVLRRRNGDSFDAGLIDGPRGKGTLTSVTATSISIRFEWLEEPPPLDPIELLVGLPRPQAGRRILHEMTSLGVARLRFITADKGEAGYSASSLWTSGEWRRHLIAGAQQAFTTRLPEVTVGQGLARVVESLGDGGTRLALDNYEAACSLGETPVVEPVTLALGPERGWSGRERDLLRAHCFELAHLGERVLRTETACIAAVAVVKAKLALL
jgi:RsmE family RNA methyltransferase